VDDSALIQWAVSGAVALVGGGIVHLHLRVIEVEKQIIDVVKTIRDEHTRSIADVWAARERDRDQREKDKEDDQKFRHYILTTVATKEDINALEVRVSGAVRMIVNERIRRADEREAI